MLNIKDLHKSYDMGETSLHVLKGINLKVEEGEMVKVDQVIGLMGSTGTTRNMLYFEIRQNGKSVNPLLYLPKI